MRFDYYVCVCVCRDELRVTLAASQKVSPSGKQGRGKGSEGGGSKENKFDAKNKRQVSQKVGLRKEYRLASFS